MARVFKCPECEAPRYVKMHCESKTCTWFYCDVCQHASDRDSGRHVEIRRPRA